MVKTNETWVNSFAIGLTGCEIPSTSEGGQGRAAEVGVRLKKEEGKEEIKRYIY
jgi:hypothetical protein